MKTVVLQKTSKQSDKKRAAELLDWLIDFLPGAIPPSAEDAILDVSEDVDALFYHRSELQKVLETYPDALNPIQKGKLAKLDRNIRAAALLLVGAAKEMLRRCREGHYDRSHWWWYLDDMLQEELIAKNQAAMRREYRFAETSSSLLKAAEPRAEYKRKSKSRKE